MLTSKHCGHPLFDPSSPFARRDSRATMLKMHGYLGHKLFRANQVPRPFLGHDYTPLSRKLELARHLAEVEGATIELLDAMRVEPVVFSTTSEHADLVAKRTNDYLVIVREEDGSRTITLLLNDHGRGLPGHVRGELCRVFFLEPPGLTNLARVLELPEETPLQQLLTEALRSERLRDNIDVARHFDSTAELEGHWKGDALRFVRVSAPDDFTSFPPRAQPLTVVLVFGPDTDGGES
jgi:hypothetical protein